MGPANFALEFSVFTQYYKVRGVPDRLASAGPCLVKNQTFWKSASGDSGGVQFKHELSNLSLSCKFNPDSSKKSNNFKNLSRLFAKIQMICDSKITEKIKLVIIIFWQFPFRL